MAEGGDKEPCSFFMTPYSHRYLDIVGDCARRDGPAINYFKSAG
jgi:hypothetical protein